jgi:hypothetical protein
LWEGGEAAHQYISIQNADHQVIKQNRLAAKGNSVLFTSAKDEDQTVTIIILCHRMQVAKEVRKPAEVSYADLSAVAAKVDKALAGLEGASQSVQQLKTKELSQLRDHISEIRDQVCLV